MARIYTRGGDGGETSLGDGTRVPKSAARIDAYGDVDELNAVLGWAASALEAEPGAARLAGDLRAIQSSLLGLGAVLAVPGAAAADDLGAAELERRIDREEEDLPALKNFILPGGSPAAAGLHLARTVCRRAERKVVALAAVESVPPAVVIYLNRLSDYLFTAARAANRLAGVEDVTWRGGD